MRNSVKIWIIAICVMLIMVLTGVVGWTIGYQDHKKIGQTSKNLSEMTEETKEEMIQETTVTITEEMTEETTEKITEETQTRTEEPGENEQSAEQTVKSEESSSQGIEDTGIVVCIDPGHYQGASKLSGDNLYGYEEGVFTLKVALALRDELQKYGIQSYLTRKTDSITIAGYTNGDLDHGKISLRGEYAKDADLFVSIHTNANKDQANGYPTCSQPVSINKTIVLVNAVAVKSEQAITIANEIGKAMTKTSYDQKLCTTDQFQVADADHLTEWTDSYNDSLNTEGTVCYRWGEHGDYYGVLRGASNVGVAGMIIEHGFHTVEEVRRQAKEEDLAEKWAQADAYGIAKGFGVIE